jgi:hypothetical protein
MYPFLHAESKRLRRTVALSGHSVGAEQRRFARIDYSLRPAYAQTYQGVSAPIVGSTSLANLADAIGRRIRLLTDLHR